MAALRQQLQARSEDGAGLAELLAQLKRSNRRLGPGRRLTDAQFDELSLYCWTLQSEKPTAVLWGRARELWGGSRTTLTGREQVASRRRRGRATE